MRLITSLLALALVGCAGGGRQVAQPSAAPAPVVVLRDEVLWKTQDAYLQGEARKGFSGVVLISAPGQAPVVRAYSTNPRITPDTRFWIGSLVKPMTAAVIYRLKEQGRLKLDDRLDRFFPDAPADKRGITLAQLLSHSAGMPDLYAANGEPDRRRAARALLAAPLIHAPGTAAVYSNDGYMLLGLMAEVASGRSFESILRDLVLKPAGMTETRFWPAGLGTDAMAPVAELPAESLRRPNWGYRSSGGMSSTARDLEKFARAMLSGRILSPAGVRDAMAPHIRRAEARDVGYGWFSEAYGGGRLISHSGAESGLQHFAWLYIFEPSQTVVVVLSNSPEDRSAETVDGIVARVAAEQRYGLKHAAPPTAGGGR